jgi:hypothetical protein
LRNQLSSRLTSWLSSWLRSWLQGHLRSQFWHNQLLSACDVWYSRDCRRRPRWEGDEVTVDLPAPRAPLTLVSEPPLKAAFKRYLTFLRNHELGRWTRHVCVGSWRLKLRNGFLRIRRIR